MRDLLYRIKNGQTMVIAASIVIAIAILIGGRTLSAAQPERNYVNSIAGEIRSLLAAGDIKRANGIFADRFDMELFSKRCLEDHWAEFSPEERKRFADLLTKNIRKRMEEKILFTNRDASFIFKVGAISPADQNVIRIDNRITVKQGDFGLGVYLAKKGKALYAVDYDFDGALLSRNYRSQFNYIFRESGKAGIFAKLENNLLKRGTE